MDVEINSVGTHWKFKVALSISYSARVDVNNCDELDNSKCMLNVQ